MTLDPASPTVVLRRFKPEEPPHMRQRFAKDLIAALNKLEVKPGEEFVVAPLIVQPSLEEPRAE